MKKFKFQLDTLLKVTCIKKNQAELKFAEISRKLADQQHDLMVFLEDMQRGQQDYDRLIAVKRINIGTLMTYNSFFSWKRSQIEKQQQEILQTKAERQKRLELLVEIMHKLKSIEQLREKRLQQYKDQIIFEEQKLLDEIGLQLYMRGSGRGEHV
jgi:flagellar protein FliJ